MTDAAAALLVSAVSGAISLVAIGLSARGERRRQVWEHSFQREIRAADRRAAAEDVVAPYREPLVFAADQLRNRLWNICRNGFFARYGASHRAYTVETTLHTFAELLGWMEILRRERQFLDLGEIDATKQLNERLSRIGRRLSSDQIPGSEGGPARFMVWRHQQRAIGELMIDGSSANGARCIGVAAFTARLRDGGFDPWLDSLRNDVEEALTDLGGDERRLGLLDEDLRALIEHLDPQRVRSVREFDWTAPAFTFGRSGAQVLP